MDEVPGYILGGLAILLCISTVVLALATSVYSQDRYMYHVEVCQLRLAQSADTVSVIAADNFCGEVLNNER